MTYLDDSAPWQRRRRRRQRITMAVIVVLVIVAGLVGAGLYLGVLRAPAKNQAATAPAPCPTVSAVPSLAPTRIKVNVYNATGRAGLAANTAAAMRRRGFVIGAVANDPVRAKVVGTADVRYGARGALAAHVVAALVVGARLVPDRRLAPTVDLVLGPQFIGLAPAPTSTSAPASPTCASGSPSPSSPPTTGVPKTRPTTTPR